MNNARDLVRTGIESLDEIFGGGLLRGNSVVFEGRPGTGKTSLAIEMICRGATELNEPGIIVTFEIARHKVIRDAAGFGWDLDRLEAENRLRIFELDPADFFAQALNPASPLWTEIDAIGAKRILIDGARSLRLVARTGDSRSFREVLTKALRPFDKAQLLTILTTENSETQCLGEPGDGDEQFLCDSIVTLRNQARRRSVHRSLEITKSRGQQVLGGRHAFRIHSDTGVTVYPRSYARRLAGDTQPTSYERSSTGLATLDQMMGGGVLTGSTTLVVGISGTGKTVLGTQFLLEGAKQGKKGLFVTLDEHRQQIVRNAANMDLPLAEALDKGDISILYDPPFELDIDEHFYRIRDCVERQGIKRVVIDSLAAYENAQPEEFHEFTFALTAYFKEKLIETIFAFEGPELFGVSQISDHLKTSTIVDNIILMNYVEISTILRRAITVPKTRGGRADNRTREYIIQKGGIAILDDSTVTEIPEVPQLPLSAYYGVLARAPTRRSPVIDEHLASGSDLPASHVPRPEKKDGGARKDLPSHRRKR